MVDQSVTLARVETSFAAWDGARHVSSHMGGYSGILFAVPEVDLFVNVFEAKTPGSSEHNVNDFSICPFNSAELSCIKRRNFREKPRTTHRSEVSCTLIPESHPVVMCLSSGDKVVTPVGIV
jgi:hypothetical protein